MVIEIDDFKKLHDFEAGNRKVVDLMETACADWKKLMLFLARYTSWNQGFGAGVCVLAAKIARSQLFWDRSEAIKAVADRNVLVASYFFDAARDEFDDRATAHRDTHRCLAQAMMKGVAQWSELDAAEINRMLEDPMWLTGLQDRVRIGYGSGTRDDAPTIFRAMGYHLGSELLADEEFTTIDKHLREKKPDLVKYLAENKVEIAEQKHDAYLWISSHSGAGGHAEADHFDWAVRGVKMAFDHVEPQHRKELREWLLSGFSDFARDHDLFFARVLT